jgi:hypothetical protein
MKKLILLFILSITNVYADYISSGFGENRGSAYITAMSKAPSGNHWILSSVNYGRHYRGYFCTIIWKQRNLMPSGGIGRPSGL